MLILLLFPSLGADSAFDAMVSAGPFWSGKISFFRLLPFPFTQAPLFVHSRGSRLRRFSTDSASEHTLFEPSLSILLPSFLLSSCHGLFRALYFATGLVELRQASMPYNRVSSVDLRNERTLNSSRIAFLCQTCRVSLGSFFGYQNSRSVVKRA